MKNHRTRRPPAAGRLARAMVAGLVIPWVAASTGARADESPPDVYQARAEAGAVTDSLSVPVQDETYTPYSLSEAQKNSSHGLHAVVRPGVVQNAAAFQQGLGAPPGTTETFYPQGPLEAKTDLVPLPGELAGDPGSAGWSSGRSGPTGSSGEAGYAGLSPSAPVSVQVGRAQTATTAGSVVRSTAEVVLQQVHIAGFAADTVTTVAEAAADGSRGGAHASGSVTVAGATLMGTPVSLTPTGLTVGQTTAEVPGTSSVDELMAQAGVSVRRLPDTRTASADGTESQLDIGGVEVRFGQPGQELSSAFVLGRASVRARAVRVSAAPGIPPEVPTPPRFTPDTPTESDLFPDVAGVLLSGPLPAARPEPGATGGAAPGSVPAPVVAGETVVAGQTVVAPQPGTASPPAAAPPEARPNPMSKREPVQPTHWTLLSALVLLAATGALLLRRILRPEPNP